MQNANHNQVAPLTKVIDALGKLDDRHNTLIADMIEAVFNDGAFFSGDFVSSYFRKEKASERAEIQRKTLSAFSDEYGKECQWIEDQMDMPKNERDTDKLERVKRRHTYLGAEMHKAFQALIFLRNGGHLDGDKNPAIGPVKSVKTANGRFRFWYVDPEDGSTVKTQATYSARAIISAGQKRLETLGLRAKRNSNGPKVDHSPRATLQTTAKTFKGSIDAMLAAQTAEMQKTNPGAQATVADLSDEVEESFDAILKQAMRYAFEHDGTIDLVDVENWITANGLKVGLSSRRKRA